MLEETIDKKDTLLPDAEEQEEKKLLQAVQPENAEQEKSEAGKYSVQNVIVKNRMDKADSFPGRVITIDRTASIPNSNEAKEIAWHELKDSMIRQKILTGKLVSLEPHRISDKELINVAVINYHDYRIAIPTSEMNIIINGLVEEGKDRQARITSNMVGCDVDFIVIRLDEESHSVVASRKLAMNRKIRDFYIDRTTATGSPVLGEGSIVEARIVAVSESVLRLEVFGAECFARVYDVVDEWMADARDRYSVGDTVYVRIVSLTIGENEYPAIQVEGKSLSAGEVFHCVKQGKYLGTVTGVSKGQYFLRLDVGTNAIAHTCEGGYPLPKKKDKVSFICTRMDVEGRVAVGLISRVIRPYQ